MPQQKSSRRAKSTASTARTSKKPTRAAAKKRTTKKAAPRRSLLTTLHLSATAILVVAVGAALALASVGTTGHGDAANCTISDKLVNSCRPWFSATAGGYEMAGSTDQFQFFNKRLNNPNVLTNPSAATTLTYKMDVPHTYHTAGSALFNSQTKNMLDDPSYYSNAANPLLINWKPGNRWADTAKGAADASIIESAKAVKALGSRKVFLTLWHEPENKGDLMPDGITYTSGCKQPDGTRGTAADYRGMWQHVRKVFDAQGVTNAVWFINYTGYTAQTNGWDCVVKPLWPGNDYIDWVMWDPYSPGGNFNNSIDRFYNWLLANSDAAHDFKSKPWGVAEFGSNSDPADTIRYWNEGKASIGTTWATNKYNRIKLWSVFDTASNGGTNGGLRVGYNNLGAIDKNEQAAFNAFAQNILKFSDPSTSTPAPGKDTIPPTVTITSPAPNSVQKGTITVKGTASDNVKVTSVTLRIDDVWVAADTTAPYEFKVDTTKYKEGQHSIVLRAWDGGSNMAQSSSVVIKVDNILAKTADEQLVAPIPQTTTLTTYTVSSVESPTRASGTIIVSPSVAGRSVEVWVGDKLQTGNIVDTSRLTNGVHAIKIVEDGNKASYQLVSVNNPPLVAAANHFIANMGTYIAYFVTASVLITLYLGRTYVFGGLTSARERSITKAQRSYRRK